MSLAIFSPYGAVSKETGFLMVLARYLTARGYGVTMVRCNGVFSRCGRDRQHAGGRTFATCIDCMNEQNHVSQWGDFASIDLSPYIDGMDINDQQTRLAHFSPTTIDRFYCEGVRVSDVIAGAQSPAQLKLVSEKEELPLAPRDEMLLAAQALTASAKLISERPLDGLLIPVGDDFLLRSFAAAAEKKGVKIFRFKWNSEQMMMNISGGEYPTDFNSHLFFDDINSMRADVSSWPREIVIHLKEIEDYLGITQQQLSLPMR